MMSKILDKISNFYLINSFAGFLLISISPSLFGLNDASFSVSYRVFILICSLFIIFTGFKNKNYELKISPYFLVLIFWLIYSLRILYDLFIVEIYLFPEKNSSDYFQMAFGVSLIPFLAVIYTKIKKLNFEVVLQWIYKILFFSLLISLFFRGEVDVTGRSIGDIEIGVLLYGQYGATLSLLSVFLLMRNNFTTFSLVYILGFILGFITIFISASRSPFLALILVTLIFVFLRKGGFKMLLISSFVLLLIYFYFLDIIQFLNNYFPSSFLTRLQYAINEGNSGGRENLIARGFNEFIDNPFFGNAMLIQSGIERGSYPHNLVVEAFMATGFFGGTIFVFWILKCLNEFRVIVKENFQESWVGLLFLQFLIFGMFSGSLFSSNLFWLSSVLVIAAGLRNHNLKTVS